jgi:hypothetical protein
MAEEPAAAPGLATGMDDKKGLVFVFYEKKEKELEK